MGAALPSTTAAHDLPEGIDVIVLGLGPGGEEVAGCLAEAGLSVVGVDAGLVGGECPYWGCIPSKMMVRAAGLLAEARRVPGMAGSATVDPQWRPVVERIADATDGWDDEVAVKRFTDKGGHFVRGWGVIEGPRRVRVGGSVLEADEALVVATGSTPSIPSVSGLAGTPYWTNREAIECEELPESLAILGGGAIGVEMGQVFARFGVTVTVIEAAPRLVVGEEPESSAVVRHALESDGVTVRTGVEARAVEASERGFAVELADGTWIHAGRLLVATGRHGNLAAIGAGSLGIDVHGRGIPVDERLRAAPGVWAIGDVTGIGAFTHLSMYQAKIAADDILGRHPAPASYHALPRVTFTDPEVGAVGMTENEATKAGMRVKIGVAELSTSARGWIHGPGNAGFVKLVADAGRQVLVGATSAGPCGGEVLSVLALAVHAAVPVDELRRMIFAYPTFHRAIEAALGDLDLTG